MNALPRFFLAAAAALTCTITPALAVEDTAPVDTKSILQALKTIKEQQTANTKSQKGRFIQEASTAASNPSRAMELWEEAVRATQFQGVSKENAQWKEW